MAQQTVTAPAGPVGPILSRRGMSGAADTPPTPTRSQSGHGHGKGITAYRPEIDGLRALAVLPVMLFHAAIPPFSGGFVGVDVFFVISGFLITGIILNDLERGRFSILTFYERRARRILPALIVVVAACLPLAWMWMLPDRFATFGQSVASVGLFVSNVFFWRASDYFAEAAELKPLLHTWSLAIEEQFYLIFPPMLALVWRGLSERGRSGRWLVALMAGMALVSLGLAQWASQAKPLANFYLLPTRAWELLAGVLCALALRRPGSGSGSGSGSGPRSGSGSGTSPVGNWAGLAGLAGIAMILASVFVYDAATPFPSLHATLPVAGTALILLFARGENLPARLLSWRPFVMVGLISYSTYLWHQPLFAFARLRSLYHPSPALMLGLAVLSLALGWVTWRWVERPFRHHGGQGARWLPGRAAALGAGAAGLAGLVAVGLGLGVVDRVLDRVDPLAVQFAKGSTNHTPYGKGCHYNLTGGKALPDLPDPACVFGSGDSGRRIIILGDSHAEALAATLGHDLEAQGHRVEHLSVTDCNPFPGFDKRARPCHAANLRILDHIRAGSYDLIVLAFRPQTMLNFPEGYDNGEGGVETADAYPVIYDHDYLDLDTATPHAALLEKIYRDGLALYLETGAEVVVIYPVPEAGWNVPQLASKLAMVSGRTEPGITTSHARYLERNAPVLRILDGVDHPRLHRVRPDHALCSPEVAGRAGRCANTSGQRLLYYDDDHLSDDGVALLLPDFRKAVREALADRPARPGPVPARPVQAPPAQP